MDREEIKMVVNDCIEKLKGVLENLNKIEVSNHTVKQEAQLIQFIIEFVKTQSSIDRGEILNGKIYFDNSRDTKYFIKSSLITFITITKGLKTFNRTEIDIILKKLNFSIGIIALDQWLLRVYKITEDEIKKIEESFSLNQLLL